MKKTFQRMTAVLIMALAVAFLASTAVAQCPAPPPGKAKLHREAWQVPSETADATTDPIVGMWRIQFLMGGEVFDQGITQWHSDGTELMNSSRNPDTQSFCLGVWQNLGASTYKLNHYGISWDPTTSTTSPLGLANIRQTVTLSKDGNTLSGTFIINQYDESGNTLATFSGTITAHRINVNTNLKVLF
jgi:hypothetical protein